MNILAELTKKLAEACEDSVQDEIFGTQMDHLEEITRLPDEDGHLMFRVTTWNELGDQSRLVRDMSLIETTDLLARYIAEKACRRSVELFVK